MKTLLELSREIQKDPANSTVLINTFRTTSSEVREFLLTLHKVPVYIVPALIETFAAKHIEYEPKTLRDLMVSRRFIGSLFVLREDDSDWSYQGVSANGKPMARPFNSDIIVEMDEDKEIKYVF